MNQETQPGQGTYVETVKALLEAGTEYGQLPTHREPVVGEALQITGQGSLGTITNVRDVGKDELKGLQFYVKTDLLGDREVRIVISAPSLSDMPVPEWGVGEVSSEPPAAPSLDDMPKPEW